MPCFVPGKSLWKALFVKALLLCSSICLAQSFTVSGPTSVTLYPGQPSIPMTVSVASSTYTGPVNVTVSGLPSGIRVAPSVLTLMPGSSGQINLIPNLHAGAEDFPANNPEGPSSVTRTVNLVGAVGTTTVTSPLDLTISLSNPSFVPASSSLKLPVLKINTGGAAITSRSTDVPGSITITSADGSKTIVPGSESPDNTAAFRLYGYNTALMPKPAYHVNLNTSTDLLTQMGLVCPYVTGSGGPVCDKSRNYVLLANFDDKTLLRNWSAYALANAIPYGGAYLDASPLPSGSTGAIPTPSGDSRHLPWAPHSLFVELFLNSAYQGVYQLVEEVTVDSHRVNIPRLMETQTTGDLTGGYLLEIDQHRDKPFIFKTPMGFPVGLVEPDYSPDAAVPEQTGYISQYVSTAETALFSSAFTDPAQGWRAYFDEASAVNYYLVNEIMGNVESGDFNSNVYFYKSADNPFLYMGPVWDFDVSSGNVNYQPIVNPTVPWVQTKAPWYAQWFKDPGFKADVTKQFNTLKRNGVLANWMRLITLQANSLQHAQANNFARWPMLGIRVWPNARAGENYYDEMNYLMHYLDLRIAYLDATLNGKIKTTTALSLSPGPYYLGYPADLVAHVSGGYLPSGTVSFFSGNVVIGTAPIDGTGLATLRTEELLPGASTVSAVYGGDNVNALSSSPAANITVVPARVETSTLITTSSSVVSAGTPATLTVLVVANGKSSAKPTGTVAFTSNGPLGTSTLVNGVATFTLAALPAGSHPVGAMYSGDANHVPSWSSAIFVSGSSSTVPVTINASPGSVIVDGTAYGTGLSAGLIPGSVHTISAPTPVNSFIDYVFAGWSDGGAQTHTITIPASGGNYFARFTPAASVGPGVINLDGGFPAGSVSLHGVARLSDTRLRLTNGVKNLSASAFYPTPVNVQTFTTEFLFQLSQDRDEGLTFVLQNQGPSALGAIGADLGYGGITKSVAIKFDPYNNTNEGESSTGLYTGGARPITPSINLWPTLNLHSGNVFRVDMTYNGTTLAVTIKDTYTGASATQSYTVDIPSIVGGNTAYAGFTASTGNFPATQDVLGWSLTNLPIPQPTPVVNFFNGFQQLFATTPTPLTGGTRNGNRLRLTDRAKYQAAGAFYISPVDVRSFTTDFTFQTSNPAGDGLMFVLQDPGPNYVGPLPIGGAGADLGYGGLAHSVGIKFDIYNNAGEGANSTGLYTGGARPTTPSVDLTPGGLNLRSGNPFQVHMVYNGAQLIVTITDTVTNKSATQTYTVNIPSVLGGDSAYVGFTASTGAAVATQEILRWTFGTP